MSTRGGRGPEEAPGQIQFADFLKIDMRLGTIRSAEPFPEARKPAYKLRIDFGPELGEKSSSAQITDVYTLDDVVGRQVIAIVNLPTKRVAGFKSECLVLGVPAEDGSVVLLTSEQSAPDGARVY